jgi:hypothetical protein
MKSNRIDADSMDWEALMEKKVGLPFVPKLSV